MPARPNGRPPLGLCCTAGRSIRLTQRAAANQDDYRALLGWCRSLSRVARRQRLDRPSRAGGGIDGAAPPRRASSSSPISPRLIPARTTLLAQPGGAGHDDRGGIGTCCRPALPRGASSPTPPTSCAQRSAGRNGSSKVNPSARVAVVVPTAARRQDEIERLAAAELGETERATVLERGPRARLPSRRSAPRSMR